MNVTLANNGQNGEVRKSDSTCSQSGRKATVYIVERGISNSFAVVMKFNGVSCKTSGRLVGGGT